MATPLRKIVAESTQNMKIGVKCKGFRSRDPQKVAAFMEACFSEGFVLLSFETHVTDVEYEMNDGKTLLGKDLETIVYMNQITTGERTTN